MFTLSELTTINITGFIMKTGCGFRRQSIERFKAESHKSGRDHIFLTRYSTLAIFSVEKEK